MFDIIQVDSRYAVVPEQLGTKRKFWFRDERNRIMLFKAEERGTGEDWAEKIACELCKELALPHVHYELAISDDVPGVVCEICAKPPVSLFLGNQLLWLLDSRYPIDKNKYKVSEHTVDAVVEALAILPPPPEPWGADMPPGIKTALDVFIGYVMLDAWVANQDRHHENWGVLANPLYLAPTFDHGACLARNLSDDERKERLTTKDKNRRIPAFAQRAKSAFYASDNSGKTLTTIEAWRAFSLRSPTASIIWKDRLRAVEEARVEQLLAEVPPHRLSPVGREFTLQLLLENRRRLLEDEL